jgi:hypothetical protein
VHAQSALTAMVLSREIFHYVGPDDSRSVQECVLTC